MNIKKRPLLILLIALAGSLAVFSWVILMNRYVTRPDRSQKSSTVNFTVPIEQTVVSPPPEPPARRKRENNHSADLAPLPDLGSSLSGIKLELPDFTGPQQVSEQLLGDLEDVVMTQGAVDTPPVPRNVTVPYPNRAKQRSLEGTVLVSVQVDLNGRVQNFQILESSPPGIFDKAVEDSIPSWLFKPAEYQGKPVASWVNIPIPFRLN